MTAPDLLADQLSPVLTALTFMLRREARYSPLSVAQVTVLAALADGNALRVGDVAATLHVTQPSATSLVNRLEEQGWVRRCADPSDARVVTVALTPAGSEVLGRVRTARHAVLAGRLASLSAAERRAVAAALPALTRLTAQAAVHGIAKASTDNTADAIAESAADDPVVRNDPPIQNDPASPKIRTRQETP